MKDSRPAGRVFEKKGEITGEAAKVLLRVRVCLVSIILKGVKLVQDATALPNDHTPFNSPQANSYNRRVRDH